MEPQSGIKTWQWVVTIVVIIALIIIGVMVFGEKEETTDITSVPTSSSDSADTVTAINRVTMTDQYPGNVVYLSAVQVSSPSWVAIQEDTAGVPGRVIGSAKFEAGINPGKITLSSPMVDGATYYAIIYSNDTATFNSTVNQPLRDKNGNIIMKVFKASSAVGAELKG